MKIKELTPSISPIAEVIIKFRFDEFYNGLSGGASSKFGDAEVSISAREGKIVFEVSEDYYWALIKSKAI